MTNFEQITHSVESLTTLLYNNGVCPYATSWSDECKYGWHEREQSCEECLLEWLKKECDDEN